MRNLADNRRERRPFNNAARDDGLVLRHWRKKEDIGIAALATPADSNAATEMEVDEKEKDPRVEPDYVYAKFNVKVTVPEYTEEQYWSHLKNHDWTKEETDYLIDLAQDFDLRWIVIGDRYDYRPAETQKEKADSMPVSVQAKARSIEDMKARYYDVAAKIMALKHPLPSMSTTEFELHEKMTKFDAKLETTRKKLAETLFHRSPEEVKEEELLLAELKRIVNGQEKFSQERKDLYDRLSVPAATGSTAMYKTSQELLKLMQDLLTADKNKKRRSLAGPVEGPGAPSTPATGNSDRGPRSSIGGPGDKRASFNGSVGPATGQKHLSLREEAKWGIMHHERSSSGTQFRHERINNLTKAKSNALTTKMASALQELGIPTRLTMATANVCDEFEKLIQSIHLLLDVRKVSEKLEAEIKIAKAQIEEQENGDGHKEPEGQSKIKPDGAEAEADEDQDAEGEDDDEAEVEAEKDAEAEDDDDDEVDDPQDEEEAAADEPAVADSEEDDDDDADADADAKAEEVEKTPSAPASEAPTTRRNSVRKRSASIVSHLSSKSNRSTKRQRK